MGKVKLIRCGKDLSEIIDNINAKHIMAGKKPPGAARITNVIGKKLKREDFLRNVFIRF